ncbi:energy transducer TonB [Shewanella bicestrii]|uniref:Energy transducer TonB n=1 Tax=Shewanella bicestrii TaxID=2018305 RepID=A0A220UJX3_9GAMM|nr:energy transducer TonB [Shewanella bicestrii]ASK68241.1 energy transducer TonB [Shewanella bicestrii]
MKFWASLLIILGLSACVFTATKSPFLAKEPIEVELKELENYWVLPSNSYSVDDSGLVPPNSNGYVKVRCLIDSNGEVFDTQIIESQPEGGWDEFALRAVKSQKYLAAEKNSVKVPVYVVEEFTFEF